jgi:hypothetical protein
MTGVITSPRIGEQKETKRWELSFPGMGASCDEMFPIREEATGRNGTKRNF